MMIINEYGAYYVQVMNNYSDQDEMNGGLVLMMEFRGN